MTQSTFFAYEILKKKSVSNYKNVIFDETQYYDKYKNDDLLKKSKKSNLIEF